MRGKKVEDRRKEDKLTAPITLPPLDDQTLIDIRCCYEETPDAETRTRYQMLLLSAQGQTSTQIARLVLRSQDTVVRVLKRFLIGRPRALCQRLRWFLLLPNNLSEKTAHLLNAVRKLAGKLSQMGELQASWIVRGSQERSQGRQKTGAFCSMACAAPSNWGRILSNAPLVMFCYGACAFSAHCIPVDFLAL